MDQHHEGLPTGVKAFALCLWAAFSKGLEFAGIHSWADASGAMASLVSLLLIIDWFRKKVHRSRARKRRFDDTRPGDSR